MKYFEMCRDELASEKAQGRRPSWEAHSREKTLQGFGRAKTREAEKAIDELDFILSQALDVDYEEFSDCVLKKKDYQEKKPKKIPFEIKKPLITQSHNSKFYNPKPVPPSPAKIPNEPDRSDSRYKVEFEFFFIDWLFYPKLRKEMDDLYIADFEKWKTHKQNTQDSYNSKLSEYEVNLKEWEKKEQQYKEDCEKRKNAQNEAFKNWESEKWEHERNQDLIISEWYERKREHDNGQNQFIKSAQEIREDYCKGLKSSIEKYTHIVLEKSQYPKFFPKRWDLEYRRETKILVVDYSLPDIELFPTIKKINYVISRNEFTESRISQTALNKIYNKTLYQVTLRTIYELFKADFSNLIDSIVFNGWVESINKATGQKVNACILSVQSSKPDFMEINLDNVDPKECFKYLKGVGSSKLNGLTAIAPIISINKDDKRFISSYSVAEGIDEYDNLAAMDWQDFENLIREIFEKEFSSTGGEVKITQASRDGGVDAIAFDPDPIRGGKIVIQAKRYTNVVGVSAVRDLYGTVVNEGATKGILVTTADYGPEAYNFSKDKPLSLLNGSNLLHLLEKHGHQARIDIKAAKKLLRE